MKTPSAQGRRPATNLDQAFVEENLDGFLEQRQQARVVDADAFLEERQNLLDLWQLAVVLRQTVDRVVEDFLNQTLLCVYQQTVK